MEHAAEEWARACDLKKEGREWVGPCPLCGGTDRFSVKPGHSREAVIYCRHCVGGASKEERLKWYSEVTQAVFADGRASALDNGHWLDHRRTRMSPQNTRQRNLPKQIEFHKRLWDASVPATDTPAHLYLSQRWCWPPFGTGPSLPDSVRWLPHARLPTHYKAPNNGPALPTGAGLALFAYRHQNGSLQAVSVEGLNDEGQRIQVPEVDRWRYTYGPKRGSHFTVQIDGPRQGYLVLVEGEVNALAAAWLHAGAKVHATGGTSGLAALNLGSALDIVIECDGDLNGEKAARRLRQQYPNRVKVQWRKKGDIADDLQVLLMESWQERAAIIETDGGKSRTEAEQLAQLLTWETFLTRRRYE